MGHYDEQREQHDHELMVQRLRRDQAFFDETLDRFSIHRRAELLAFFIEMLKNPEQWLAIVFPWRGR